MRRHWAILFLVSSISKDAVGQHTYGMQQFSGKSKQKCKGKTYAKLKLASRKKHLDKIYGNLYGSTPKNNPPKLHSSAKSQGPLIQTTSAILKDKPGPKGSGKLQQKDKYKSHKSKLKRIAKTQGNSGNLYGPTSSNTQAPSLSAKSSSLAPSIVPSLPSLTESPTRLATHTPTIAPTTTPFSHTPTIAPTTKPFFTVMPSMELTMVTTPPPSIMVTRPDMLPSTIHPTKSPKTGPTQSPSLLRTPQPTSNTAGCLPLASNTTAALERLIRQVNGTRTELCSLEIGFEQQISLDVPVNLTCQGTCILDGRNLTRLFSFGNVGSPVAISAFFQGFSFLGGRAANGTGDNNQNGGAVVLLGLEMSVAKFANCSFLGNTAEDSGGAISFTGYGNLDIVQSSFEGNVADRGGALYGGVDAVLTTENSSFQNNVALGGGRAGAAIAVDGVLNCLGNNIFSGNVGYPNVLGPSVGCEAAG